MKNFLIKIGLIAAAVAAFFAYDFYDKSANYAEAKAKVTGVETLCYLYKKQYKKTTTTNEQPCPLIKQAAASDPQYADFEVREKTHVKYSYDFDGKPFGSEHVQARKADGSAISVGDELPILVSKADPAKTRAK